MYQLGAWMSDADPEYAWLKFVSALEAAAVCWWRGGDDPTDALHNARPDLPRRSKTPVGKISSHRSATALRTSCELPTGS